MQFECRTFTIIPRFLWLKSLAEPWKRVGIGWLWWYWWLR